jgi:hypothetical protein
MMIPVFTGKINNGKPKLDQPELFELWPGQFKEGDKMAYRVTKVQKRRSTPQNSYLWGVVYALISQHTGYTIEEVHEAMGFQFRKIANSPMIRIRSTTTMSTVEFEEYTAKVRAWASSELNIYIPNPNDITPDYLTK